MQTDLRDSTALLASSDLSDQAPFDDKLNISQEKNGFGWSKPNKFEPSSAFGVDRIPSGRAEGKLPGSVYPDQYRNQMGGQNGIVKNAFYGNKSSEQKASRLTNKNIRNYGSPALDGKKTDISQIETDDSHSDDDLNALLKEEEDLVSAHRRQVEETLDIVREEMNLLAEADKPGNHLDGYILKLNAILSQKSAGILQLQHRLSQFQMRLKEHNVLVSYAR